MLLFFSVTSANDLLTTTFQTEGLYRDVSGRANLEVGCLVASTTKSVVSSRLRARRTLHLGGRRADAGCRRGPRGGLARLEIRCARHLAASQLGGDLIGRRRPLRGQRRPHPQASSTNGASMPSPLHAVMAAWAAPFLRICGLGVAHAPRHFGCVRSPPCPLISAPRIYHADARARARRFSLCKAAAARARARRRSRRRLLG